MTQNFDTIREGEKSAIQQEVTARQFLTFTIGEEEYGMDIMRVREIKGWTETTRLPGTPDYMRGVMNLRGLIIPIFDLRMRFHNGLTEATEKHVVIIVALNERNMGILVDTVSDIIHATADDIKPAPVREKETDTQCVNGLISHQERMVVVLDVEQLFDTNTLKAAENVAQAA